MLSVIKEVQIEQKIHESSRSVVYRARNAEGQPVILKMLQPAHTNPESIARFRREYELTRRLQGEGIIQVYDLVDADNMLGIVLEDFGGRDLTACTPPQGWDTAVFLPLAIGISRGLGAIHRQNLIHKDINPANIIWNADTGVVKIIDFGLATTLPRENPEIRNPNILEGTLAYISPEQTGRMNRAMDYRSDFYSLGVTFYFLLTGQLPFQADDALAWVHAHIARQPIPPDQIKPTIPPALAAIVMRLLAKNAEDRYQSAFGLAADLETGREALAAHNHIPSFPLGQKDVATRFQLPHKLYGRHTETHLLLDAFHRAAAADEGQVTLVLVTGQAGIGKSALVQELYRPVTARRSYFISGKFDQFHNTPYAPLIRAFAHLLEQILTESEAEIGRWRKKLAAALGANGQVMVDVLPALEIIIGPQTAVPVLPPVEAENRFNLTFQNFIRAFARPERPLVLFLDDWQWMDGASRQFLQSLLTASHTRHLLIIGAYRDNELNHSHPVWSTLDRIRASETAVYTIALPPLAPEHANQYVADTLAAAPGHTRPLTALLLEKTHGNPFFLGQYMKALHEDGWLAFDYGAGKWQWDLARIQTQDIADNVVTLMTHTIQKLDEAAQTLLAQAACIGSQFALALLAQVDGNTPRDTAVSLRPALAAGLIIPLHEQHNLVEFDVDLNLHYKFAHDRIQQAAHNLRPEAWRQQTHWQIGQLLCQHQDLAGRIFAAANQLNLGRAQAQTTAARHHLAQLNLEACRAAQDAAAFQPALEYGLTGIDLLHQTPDPWAADYALTLALYTAAVEAAFLCGRYHQMHQLADTAVPHIPETLDQLPILKYQARGYLAQNRMADVLDTILPLAHSLGVNLPRQPRRIHLLWALIKTRVALRGKTAADLLNQPRMDDPYLTAVVENVTAAGDAAYFVNTQLFALIVLQLIPFIARHGHHNQSPRIYAAYGLILAGALKKIKQGYTFGRLGLQLVDRLNARTMFAPTAQLFYHYLHHWRQPLRTKLEPLFAGYQTALETGDLTYAAYCSYSYAAHSYFAGLPLPAIDTNMSQFAAMMAQFHQHKMLYVLTMYWQTIANLMGQSDTPWILTGAHFQEAEGEAEYIRLQDKPALATYYLQKATLLYLFGQYDAADAVFLKLDDVAASLIASYQLALIPFYDSLTQIALLPRADTAGRQTRQRRLKTNQKKLAGWARHAPMNFQHKVDLVAAEWARVQQKPQPARALYERAIRGAQENEFIQEEALAFELAGRFFLKQGNGRLAGHYLQQAHQAYSRWGAMAKTAALEQAHPAFFPGEAPPAITPSTASTTAAATSSSSSTTAVLDMSSIVKASQALSGEIKLDRLLDRLMQLVIENAGAQSGYLLLPQEDAWPVAAVGGEAGTDDPLPAAVLHFVTRTREPVLLDHAVLEGPFTQDPVVQQRGCLSVLCLPLLNHGSLAGLLYLENNLSPAVFTPERLTTLNLLASQAAISIENAHLVGQLEDYGRNLENQVAERTVALAQMNEAAQAARAQAEAANENKSVFLSNMSRELRTPLNTIIGFTRLVLQNRDPNLPDKQRANLEKVLVSADHLLGLINTVIDIAKIEAGRMDVIAAEFDLVELVESCLATTQPLLQPGVRLQKDFPAPLPTVISDQAKIKQIIFNLLSNAAKFTHEGQIVVQIRHHADQLSVQVQDSGIGIAPDALARVFEEFEQAESITRKQYGGTGLGLPISRGLARLLGGDLTAVSQQGEGSTFTLTLPLCYSSEQTAVKPA